MIDMHCHVLPGIDDGPQTIEESMLLARAAVEQGTSTIVATPHVSLRYPNDAATISRAVEEVNASLRANGLALEVVPGAEIAMTRADELSGEELSRLTLGRGSWLLVECPFVQTASGFASVLSKLKAQGYDIVLAHPERCPAFHRDPDMLKSFVRAGMLVSITAASLVGLFSDTVRRFALELCSAELVHNVASDAHDHERRSPLLTAYVEQAGLSALGDWLTYHVPHAILAGESIPPRPPVAIPPPPARRRRWWPVSR